MPRRGHHTGYVLHSLQVELRHRFAGSTAGLLWLVANPLAQIVIFSIVFSRLMTPHMPELADVPGKFTIYLCAGLLPWIGVSETLQRSTSLFVEKGGVILMTAIPEEALLATEALSGLVAVLASLSVLVLAAALMGLGPALSWIVLPALLALFIAFAIGIGTLLGVINVFSRDVSHGVGIGLQVGFWLTPIVYTESIVPEPHRSWLTLNPLYWFITIPRDALLHADWPTASEWLTLIALAAGSLGLGLGFLSYCRANVRDALQ